MGSVKITVLGCGGSAGVPAAGNFWGACDPDEPKNRRNRCCIAVQSDETTLIIDTGPDFRHQLNHFDIQNLDAVLYTHYHSDHADGIADLRGFRFRNQKLVPIYANNETMQVFERTFPHLLMEQKPVYPQILDAQIIQDSDYGKEMSAGDIAFIPFEQDHYTCKTVGYRFGDFAYSVDVRHLEQDALDTLKGVKTWMVDSTGYHTSDNMVHMGLEQIYAYNKIIGAKRVILTSLSLSMDYQTLLSEIAEGYEPAYDGMILQASI
ncbi:MAG: MBL fold metallo-hydrolase [Alphaproteobacteria bacterium]